MLFLGQNILFDADQCEISIILNFGGNYFKLHILIAEECVNCHGWHGVNLSFKDVRHFNCDFSKYHRVLLHIYEQQPLHWLNIAPNRKDACGRRGT